MHFKSFKDSMFKNNFPLFLKKIAVETLVKKKLPIFKNRRLKEYQNHVVSSINMKRNIQQIHDHYKMLKIISRKFTIFTVKSAAQF